MAAAVDLVQVAAADLRPGEVAPGDQVGEDPLRGAFSDADALGDVARPAHRVLRDAQHHVSVVAEEDPAARASVRHHRARYSVSVSLLQSHDLESAITIAYLR